MFGYAGHGAVGLLDGVYNHQDDLKIIFPRIESAAGYMADAYFRASGSGDPGLHLHGARPDAADRRDGQRVLRLVRVHRDYRPGGDEPVRLGRASGGVPPPPGRLPEHGEGDHEAELPGAERRRPRQVPAQGVQARAHRTARARCTSTSRTTSGSAPPTSRCPSRRSARCTSSGARPARRRRSASALEMLMKAKRPLILAGGGVIASDATVRAAAVRRARQRARLLDLHGQGRAVGAAPVAPRHRRLLGRVPGDRGGANADVILAIGCRFSDIHCSSWVPGYTYNIPPTKLIHVDLDPQEIGRNYPTELGIVGDAREVLRAAARARRREPKRERSPWHDQVEALEGGVGRTSSRPRRRPTRCRSTRAG